MNTIKKNTGDAALTVELLKPIVKISESVQAMGVVTVIIKNTGDDIALHSASITLAMGKEANQLAKANTETSMARQPGIPDIWDLVYANVKGQFDAKIRNGKGPTYLLKKDTSLSFTISKIPLNSEPGDAPINVLVNTLVNDVPTPVLEKTLTITKVMDVTATLFLQANKMKVQPGQAVLLNFGGAGMKEFTLTSTGPEEPEKFNAKGEVSRHPQKLTIYTLDGTSVLDDIHLQTQVSIDVFLPSFAKFDLLTPAVDIGQKAKFSWQAEDADAIILTATDKTLVLEPEYPVTANALEIGPITKPTFITAYAKKNEKKSAEVMKPIGISPPIVDSFNIEALQLTEYRRFGFKLSWRLINASSLTLLEQVQGKPDVLIPVPPGVTTLDVFPANAETVYKITANPYSLAKDYLNLAPETE